MSPTIPEGYEDLLERPLFAHLATVRPDGAPQANPMWFVWDGELAWFTNTDTRQKYRNVAHEPRVAFSIHDPDNPYRYLEVRGVVERIDPDPEAELFVALAQRYGTGMGVPGDAPHRVKYGVRPTSFSRQ